MRTTSLVCVFAVLCMARVYAIHSDKHSSVLIEEHQQIAVDADINLQIRTAQEQVLESVTAGVVVTDGQIDEAVKAAFAPIFTKCEAITNIKHQKRCLLNAAAGKKVTSKGAVKKAAKKAAKKAKKAAAKKAEKKAADKAAAKIVAPKKKVVAKPALVKDKVAEDAKKAKHHLDKAAALQKKVDAEKKKAAGFQAKLKKDAKKVAAKAKEALAKVNKQAKKANKTSANKTAEAKKAAFLEFDAEMADADDLHAETMDAVRDNIFAFLEVSEEVAPHKDAMEHLESIDVSFVDLQDLEIPEVSVEDVDRVLNAVEAVTSNEPASFLEQQQAQTVAEEAETQAEENAETQTQAKAEVKVAVSDEERAHEGEASLIAAAEAEMNHDLANFGHTVKKDVIDMSDLEDIDNLNI